MGLRSEYSYHEASGSSFPNSTFGHRNESPISGSEGYKGEAASAGTSETSDAFPPRMTTTVRDAISSPATGKLIYNTTTNKLNFYNGSAWEAVTSST